MAAYGKAGTLKSWLMLEMAVSLSEGTKWLGLYETEPSSVLIVQAEVPEPMYAERVAVLDRNLNSHKPRQVFFDNDLTIKLDQFFGIDALMTDIKERKPQVIILDCLYQMVSGAVSNEVDLKRFKDNIDKVRAAYGISFVIVHHPRKGHEEQEDKGFEEMLGSGIFNFWLDSILRVEADPPTPQPSIVRLVWEKVRNAQQITGPIRVKFNRETAKFNIH